MEINMNINTMIIESKIVLTKPTSSIIDLKYMEILVHDDGKVDVSMTTEDDISHKDIVEDILELHKHNVIGTIVFICFAPSTGESFLLYEYEITRHGYRYNTLSLVKHKGPLLGGNYGK
jgi:hypothetical protein